MAKKNLDPDVFIQSATGVLRSVWGYPSFRPSQVEAIEAVGSGADVVAVLPTGGGKSLLYQVPALVREGLTVVVSPLIALMEDQVRSLKERGVAAAAIAGLLPANKAEQLFVNAQHGAYKLLYLAPERLEGDLFAAYADKLNVSLLAVDEAHCVSEWSRSFRPAYRRIPVARALMGDPQMLAVTATATPEVRADVVELLELRSPKVLVQGFRRTNLALVVERCDRRLDRIVGLLKEHDQGSAIVYATTRRTTEGTARALHSKGIPSAFYHGGLNRKARSEASERWMSGQARVMVATNAFGMGIDKSDVRLVVHAEAPGSLEAYYQEAGRAGRDGRAATAHLLWQPRDLSTHERLADASHPTPKRAAQIFDLMSEIAQVPLGETPDDPIPVKIRLIAQKLDVTPAVVSATVDVLIREGVVEQSSRRGDGMLRWLVSLEALRAQGGTTSLQAFVDALVRRVPKEAFQAPITVDLERLGRSLHMEAGRVRKGLEFLKGRGVLDYTSFDDQPWVRLLVPRTRRLALDLSELSRAKRMLDRRRDAMERYLTTDLCRMQFVLGYFGDVTSTRCGVCDVCRTATTAIVLEEEAIYHALVAAASDDGLIVNPNDAYIQYLSDQGLIETIDPIAPRVAATAAGRRWLSRR